LKQQSESQLRDKLDDCEFGNLTSSTIRRDGNDEDLRESIQSNHFKAN